MRERQVNVIGYAIINDNLLTFNEPTDSTVCLKMKQTQCSFFANFGCTPYLLLAGGITAAQLFTSLRQIMPSAPQKHNQEMNAKIMLHA